MPIAIVENSAERLERVNRLVTEKTDEFNAALMEFGETIVPSQLVLLQKKLVLEILKRVVQKTPVDTGRARGGWQVGIGEVPTGEFEIDKSGAPTITEGLAKLRELGFGEIVFVANSVNYILYLEDGSSSRAPRGMLRVTIEEVQTVFPDRGEADVT